MINFKKSNVRENSYYYRTGTTGKIVKAEVYYNKGGVNFYNGQTNSRGIYVSLTPVTMTPEGYEQWELGGGICACIKTLPRFNTKALLEAVERLDAMIPQYAAHFTVELKREIIRDLVDMYTQQLQAA